MHTDIHTLWQSHFQPIGHTFRRPSNEKHNPKRPKYVTGWNNKASSIISISKIPKETRMFLLEVTMYFESGHLRFETRIAARELALLAKVDNGPSEGIPEIAEQYGASLYLPGVCLQHDYETIILIPNSERVIQGPSIICNNFFTVDMIDMIEYGHVRTKI
jgi:hypothetical protein